MSPILPSLFWEVVDSIAHESAVEVTQYGTPELRLDHIPIGFSSWDLRFWHVWDQKDMTAWAACQCQNPMVAAPYLQWVLWPEPGNPSMSTYQAPSPIHPQLWLLCSLMCVHWPGLTRHMACILCFPLASPSQSPFSHTWQVQWPGKACGDGSANDKIPEWATTCFTLLVLAPQIPTLAAPTGTYSPAPAFNLIQYWPLHAFGKWDQQMKSCFCHWVWLYISLSLSAFQIKRK